MCPAGVLNGCRAPRWKGNGYTCAKCMPQNGLQSRSEEQVNFRNQRRIANPSPSAAFRSQAESAFRQYRAVRWFLLPETELCLRPAAMLDCKSCVAKWTRTGTGGGLENPAQQRYNCPCHQPFLAIMRTDGLAAPKRKKRMLDFASALRRVRLSNLYIQEIS